MELEWKTPVQIPDGKKTGEIIRIDYRTDPYEYTDIIIKLEGEEFNNFEMKYGCPTVLSENSKLGRTIVSLGEKFEAGKKLDPEKILVGKKVEFMTITRKSKKDGREYSEIVEDSLKLLEGNSNNPKVEKTFQG